MPAGVGYNGKGGKHMATTSGTKKKKDMKKGMKMGGKRSNRAKGK